MATNLPPELFPKVTQLLQPYMVDVDEREAWLTQAFYLKEPRLYQMDRAGSAMVFTTRCVRTLMEFGCFTDPEREHSLATLLKTIRYGCGPDKQSEIDLLVPIVDEICHEPDKDDSATTPSPSVPAQPVTVNTPLGDRRPTVFLSYSHGDKEFAERLIGDLQRAGHQVWIDTTALKGGDLWVRAIAEGIINSYAFLVVVSRKALQSQYVQDEITWAKTRNKRILVALLEDVVSDVEFFPLVNIQGVKFYDTDYSVAIQSLIAGLPAPSIQSEGIKIEPAPVSQRALELQYLDRLRFEILLNTEKYTPLAGESQHQKVINASQLAPVVMRPEYALLGREKDAMREVRRFDNAVDEIRNLRRVVVLGEPGAGKTTTLWKLARQLVDEAIEDPKKPIPLVIRLGKWTKDSQPFQDFIAQELGELGYCLPALMNEKRAALLLDGLNEIPVSQRRQEHNDKDRQVKVLVDQQPDLLAVISCRALDYNLDLGFDRIEISPLDPIRIREFVQHYLNFELGEKLFYRLVGESAAQTEKLFLEWESNRLQNPMRIFWVERELPNKMKWGLSWNRDDNSYWDQWLRQRDQPASLLVMAQNPYMLSMLTQLYVTNEGELPDNRGELFRDFVLTLLVREKIVAIDKSTRRPLIDAAANRLLDKLSQLAYEMQFWRGYSQDSNALTILPVGQVRRILSDEYLYLAGSASILSVGSGVRFSHQLLQEYFAARQMDAAIKSNLKATTIWKPDKWWEPTNWEEATILLAGLYNDDCTPIVKWVADANPEVAARCIVQSGAQTPNETREWLRNLLLPRLTNVAQTPDARAAVGRALGMTNLDSRFGVGVDKEGLVAIDWVEIPTGDFLFQKNQKVNLPTFLISRYLITYAQFQAFIDAPDGFTNLLWWNGLTMDEKHSNVPGDQAFKYGNYPRETVSWYEAVAFCRWLSSKLGYEIRLPTEEEWEKAARGTDGRKYPYGKEFDLTKGNTNETGIGQTSAVGIFPNGASPFGVEDMSGNVWEWCLNEYSKPENIQLASAASRVQRGGSWNFDYYDARTGSRNLGTPNSRSSSLGFRVVCPIVSADGDNLRQIFRKAFGVF